MRRRLAILLAGACFVVLNPGSALHQAMQQSRVVVRSEHTIFPYVSYQAPHEEGPLLTIARLVETNADEHQVAIFRPGDWLMAQCSNAEEGP